MGKMGDSGWMSAQGLRLVSRDLSWGVGSRSGVCEAWAGCISAAGRDAVSRIACGPDRD